MVTQAVVRRPLSMPMWPVRNRCADPFGPGVLDAIDPVAGMKLLGEAKKAGWIDFWSAHDCDLVLWNSNDPEDYLRPDAPIHVTLKVLREMANVVDLKMNIITCDLHGQPLFRNGGFTNPNPAIRVLALKKALRAAWIGNFFGAMGVTYWTARDGFEVAAAVPFRGVNPARPKGGSYQWLQQALDIVSTSCRNQKYSIRFGTIEPKTNEPRGVQFLPLVGSALNFINSLDDPDFWCVNPEVPQHSAMGNQEPLLEVVQAVEASKLAFLHLGNQIDGQFDNDFPPLFGPTNLKRTVQIFYYLTQVGWQGVVEFDCHVLRSDTAPGPENSTAIRTKFMRHCVFMYRLIEQILVPRLLADKRVDDAQRAVWQPEHLGKASAGQLADLLASQPSAEEIQQVRVDAQAALECPAPCGDVDFALTLALFGISENELAKVIAS